MEQTHISKAFDKDLNQIKALVEKMASIADKQISGASKALRKGDDEIAQKVIDKDARMNLLEQEVLMEATRVLALRQPKASDLRSVVAVIKVSGHIERIGDYAKNIAQRSGETADTVALESSTKSIKRMGKHVRTMLAQAIDAYGAGDGNLAAEVIAQDEDLDDMYNSLLRELLTHMMEDAKHISACAHLLFIARNLERMGDHVTDIAQQVVYIQTGELS